MSGPQNNSLILKLARSRVAQHSLFWLAYLWPTCYYLLTVCTFSEGIVPLLVCILLTLSAAYVNLNYLVPHFLVTERYPDYFIRLIILFLLYCSIYTAWYIYFLEHFFKVSDHETYGKVFMSNLMSLAFMLQLTTAFKLSKDWFRQQQINKELEHQKLHAEVQFLRAQINPHFLFNTLNNLYALTLKKSGKAPETVLKLSGIMEYMLYESNEPEVVLEKEIEYLQHYIEIEKLRHSENKDITFCVEGNTKANKIAPLLLLPFVENAFKHGLNKTVHQSYIHISLIVEKGCLIFTVENNRPAHEQAQDGPSGGLGIANTRKRLALLYPDRHELYIIETEGTYKAVLKIRLTQC